MHLTLRGDLAVATLAALALAIIVIRATWWPTKRCRRCDGEGTHPRRWHPKRTMLCQRCHGIGRHIRPTRRIANRVINARRDAARAAERLAP